MIEKLMEFLFQRRNAYCRLFKNESPDAKLVLTDLAHFCRAHDSTFHPDERTQALLEGRREVWLRIQRHLNLTEEELWSIFHKG